MNKIVIGSRGSRLALIQTNQVIDILQKAYPNVDISIEVIRTEGDIQKDKPLHELGGNTVFAREIEKHLLDKKIGLSVGYSVCYNIVKELFDQVKISLKYEDLYDAITRLKETQDYWNSMEGREKWKKINSNNINGSFVLPSILFIRSLAYSLV